MTELRRHVLAALAATTACGSLLVAGQQAPALRAVADPELEGAMCWHRLQVAAAP